MAEKSATYKIFNGSDWDTYYFKTSAGQVGETTNLKFLHLDTHKVNNKAFTATSGITLYGTDIKMASSSTTDISSYIAGVEDNLDELEEKLTNGSITVYKSERDGSGNIIKDTYVTKAMLGVSSTSTTTGIATLDTTGKVPTSQLPSFVDDVLEGTLSGTTTFKSADGKSTLTAEAGKIYVDISSQKTYRWSGTQYVEISSGGVALGETSSTAYAGDKGKTNATNISTLQGYFTDGIAKKATADASGNNIVSTYQPKTLSSNIVVNGNTTNANTVVGVLGNLATYINSITGTISGLGNTYATKTEVTKVSTGSTTPSNPKTGDIWLYFS